MPCIIQAPRKGPKHVNSAVSMSINETFLRETLNTMGN